MALLRRMGGRLLQLVLLLAAASVLSFWLMQLAGSDAGAAADGGHRPQLLSQQALDAARAELGLDRPVWVQYLSWLGGVLQGDLGTSYLSGQPVAATFAARLPATLLLAGLALAMTVAVSLPLGILAAVYHGRPVDWLLRAAGFVGGSPAGLFSGTAADGPVCHPAAVVSGDCRRHQPEKRLSARADTGHCHVGQISAPGAGRAVLEQPVPTLSAGRCAHGGYPSG